MGFIESLIHAFCMNMAIESYKKEYESNLEDDGLTLTDFGVGPHIYSKEYKVNEKYVPLQFSEAEYGHIQAGPAICIKEFKALPCDVQCKIEDLHRDAEDSFKIADRMKLVSYLLSVRSNDGFDVTNLIHNEILYISDEYPAVIPQEEMFQSLCRFIDAEYYFFKGEFVSSLIRLYGSLRCEHITKSPWLENYNDENGTEELYRAAVSNIINIYALLGLADEAKTVRKIFKQLATATRKYYREWKNDFSHSRPESRKYAETLENAFEATNEFVGLMSFTNFFCDETDFDNILLDKYARKLHFFMQSSILYDIKTYAKEPRTGCENLVIEGLGKIKGYKEKIESARDKAKIFAR